MLGAWLHARIVLGLALMGNILRRVLRPGMMRRRPGRWLQQVAQEGLRPTPAVVWDTSPFADACSACGLCEAELPTDVRPSVWLPQHARLPSDADCAADIIAKLRPHAALITARCPQQVDVEGALRRLEGYLSAPASIVPDTAPKP